MLMTDVPVTDTELLDGTRCVVRGLTPEDHPAMEQLFDSASDDNIYRRFFGISRHLAHSFVDGVCVVGDTHVALVAEIAGELVGMIDAEQTSAHAAEVSLFVADHFHHRGIGTALLHVAADGLRRRGFTTLTADVLTLNAAMLHVFQHSGLVVSMHRDESVVAVTMSLRTAGNADADPASQPPKETA